MTQFATRWSSGADSNIGTVAHLRELLEEIIVEEISLKRLKHLPTEAAQPQFLARERTQLGTPDADVLEVESRALFSAAEVERKAELAVERRRAAGISDDIEDMQQLRAPAFDQSLVGKRLEVLWKYVDKANSNKATLIWASGRVVRVADGLAAKRSKKAKQVLPAGAVLWAWDADPEFDEVAGEQRLILLPKQWNKHVHYGWRFDPSELGGQRERAAAPASKRARCASD
jgi:DICT domain-containing protein